MSGDASPSLETPQNVAAFATQTGSKSVASAGLDFRDGRNTAAPTAARFPLFRSPGPDLRRPPSPAWKSLALCRNRPQTVAHDFPNGTQERTGQEGLPNESELRVRFRLPRDQDDGHCRKSSLHSLSKGHSVAVWHVDVADDQSNLVSKFLHDPKTVGTVSSLDGLEMLPLQNGADELPNGRFVINNQRDASHASLDGQ